MFDPTLSEETGKQVGALEGVTFHPYGLGAVDGKVRLPYASTTMPSQCTADQLYSASTVFCHQMTVSESQSGHRTTFACPSPVSARIVSFLPCEVLCLGRDGDCRVLSCIVSEIANQCTWWGSSKR